MKKKNKDSFTITNNTKGRPYIQGLPFTEIKNKILGTKYVLSLVFVEDKESKRLNHTYRGKNKPTNVLSFPLSKNLGEVIINTDSVQREHREFKRTKKNFIAFLYIHALFHLKGFDHGSRMETEEKKIRIHFHLE